MMQAYCFRFYFLLVTVIIFAGMVCVLDNHHVERLDEPSQSACGWASS